MDRDGQVIARLNALLPPGRVLDVGAGDGFTAQRLTRADRVVIPLEPAGGMIDRTRAMPWVQAVAQDLPFSIGSFAAAYATWAYFFPAIGHGDAGLRELNRVVAPSGPIVVIDNAGEDEFTALAEGDMREVSDPAWWAARGFDREIILTSFRFDSLEEARELLCFYFGERARARATLTVEYKVAIFVGRACS